MLVKDINPGPATSNPSYLTNVNGILFFAADSPSTGKELWKSNGTAAGTVLVKDINPGAAGSSNPMFFVNVNGTLFFSAFEPTDGESLWKSNGTAAGTVLVKEINPSGAGSYPFHLTNVSGTLFFDADDGTHGSNWGAAMGRPPAPCWSSTSLRAIRTIIPPT